MRIANDPTTVEDVVEFINTNQCVMTVFRPVSGEHTSFEPIAHASSDGDVLGWQNTPSHGRAERVRSVEKSETLYRVVLDSLYEMEIHVYRAVTKEHRSYVEALLKDSPEAHESRDIAIGVAKKRSPWGVRDKEGWFVRWFGSGGLVGVIGIAEDGIAFVPANALMRDQMKAIKVHYEPIHEWYQGLESGLKLFEELADATSIGREVTAAEYVKAFSAEDAANLGREIAVGDYQKWKEGAA